MNRIKPSEKLKELTLLYVEDENAIRETFVMMISRYFKKIYTATNGKEGLEIFKTHQDEIDIIISDIKMPVMTGLDMARGIKDINYEKPIIFTTAFGDSEYLKEAIDVGADGYIVKPIDRNKVFERLNIIANSVLAKKEAERYFNLIQILFEYQKDGVVLLDDNLNIKIYNNSFAKILENANIENPKTVDDLIVYCKDEKGNSITRETLYENLNHRILCYSVKTGRYFDIDIKQVGSYIFVNLEDITTYKKENEKIQETAMIDSLTQVYNRKKLELLNGEFLKNNLCLIMFDIDNFKKINDTYGHLKGDEVLKTLAEIVKKNIRGSDLVVRWGGEEFIVVLQGLKDINIAKNLAEKLRKKITEIEIEEVGHFSCSFGVACDFIDSFSDIENLFSKVDEALYSAKRNGKNRVETHS